MIRQFVRDLEKELSDACLDHSIRLGKGQAQDYADYKRVVGYIAGLDKASQIARQMLQRLTDIESDSDLPTMEDVA